ncbi:MAG: hypothetical protein MJ131_04115 [Lachnospiraceae bacterium]|nr:hypothetical protein [Lachnospiraceae bacterium]
MAIFNSDDKKGNQQLAEQVVSGISETISRAISDSLAPVFTVFAANVKKSLDSANDRQANSVEEMTAAFMDRLESSTKGSFQSISDTAAQSAAAMKTCMEGEAELVASIKSAVSEMKEISAAQKSVLDEMKTATSELKECIATAASEMKEAVTAASDGMKYVTTGVSDKMNALTTDTVNSLKTVYDDISKSLKNISEGQSENLKDLHGVLMHLDEFNQEQKAILSNHQSSWAANYVKADEEVNKNSEELLTQMTRYTKSMTTYTVALNEVSDSMKIQLPAFEEQLAKTVNDIFAVLDKQLAEVAETLGKTTEEINAAADRLPKALRGLA